MSNKQGQIGETMTWVIATIIIIMTLIVFIYVSSVFRKTIDLPDLKDSEKEVDWLEIKTSFAHLMAQDKNKKIIDEWIEGE